jgi:integrase
MMAMPEDLPAARDRALLLLGYVGAFRRSELVALDVADLRFSDGKLPVWIAAANDPRVLTNPSRITLKRRKRTLVSVPKPCPHYGISPPRT